MTCKIAIVGEAWGEHEERQRSPFVGPSGYELTRMLNEAGINRADCYLTNVFNLRPKPTNDIENLCTDKSRGMVNLGPLKAGKYLKPEYAPELKRLGEELRSVKANITIALGNTACWFLLGNSGVSKLRGTVIGTEYGKVIPAYHPAAILREWSLRHVTVLDLMKAARESEFPEVHRPERTVYIDPSLEEMEWYYDNFLRDARRTSIDIETAGNQITCIGFAPDHRSALVVPFFDPRKPGNNYWTTLEAELCAWNFVRRVCQNASAKTFQNGMYDLHFLWRGYGIPTVNCEDDTMLLHHSLLPESEKGLGFMGSVYTNEASWKLMRSRGKTTIKRDE